MNDDVAAALKRVKAEYPTLDNSELFKLSLAELDRKVQLERRKRWEDSLPTLYLNEAEQLELDEALEATQHEQGQLMTVEDIMAEALTDI